MSLISWMRWQPCTTCLRRGWRRGRGRTSTACSVREARKALCGLELARLIALTPQATYGHMDAAHLNPVEKSSPALAQISEPIRGDLERVDREFGRHVQSHVDLIPK